MQAFPSALTVRYGGRLLMDHAIRYAINYAAAAAGRAEEPFLSYRQA